MYNIAAFQNNSLHIILMPHKNELAFVNLPIVV